MLCVERKWLGKKHATVDYVFRYSPYKLFQYHQLVMDEMEKRGYSPAPEWTDPMYRGKSCEAFFDLPAVERSVPIYPEHDEVYLAECLANLEQKEFILPKKEAGTEAFNSKK